ncbi:fluoride efflux transporter FluC [Brachybacterium kimchii]|uniref:Fluoride-specific ion channel FluC n=1 Tax=Brachybacterium kimchii TaxID=2942909 RepID=A0ABY4NAK9_9MICO|nr:CrcB family protein [Brachybacterium kimchii]UQN31572.1 CrcB family protein [Brachybacterium kimchii]
MTTPPAPRRRDDPRMRTVEMEAVSVTAEEEDSETLSSGPGLPPLSWQRTLLLVACGGVAGGVLRELFTLLMPTIQTPTLIEVPRSTLLVNVLGCVGLGILTGLLERQPDAPRWMRPLLGIGFLEGFTIYSGVVLEGSAMIGADFPALAFVYGAITVFGAIGGVLLGLGLAALLHRRGIRLGGRPFGGARAAHTPVPARSHRFARVGHGSAARPASGTGTGADADSGSGSAEALTPESDASDAPAPVPSLDAPGDAEVHTTLSSATPAAPSPRSPSRPSPRSAAPAPRRPSEGEGR